jgi:hypothetical protein
MSACFDPACVRAKREGRGGGGWLGRLTNSCMVSHGSRASAIATSASGLSPPAAACALTRNRYGGLVCVVHAVPYAVVDEIAVFSRWLQICPSIVGPISHSHPPLWFDALTEGQVDRLPALNHVLCHPRRSPAAPAHPAHVHRADCGTRPGGNGGACCHADGGGRGEGGGHGSATFPRPPPPPPRPGRSAWCCCPARSPSPWCTAAAAAAGRQTARRRRGCASGWRRRGRSGMPVPAQQQPLGLPAQDTA